MEYEDTELAVAMRFSERFGKCATYGISPVGSPYVCRKVTDITSGVRGNKSWLIFIDMQIALLKACLPNLVNKITSPAFLLVRRSRGGVLRI